MPEDQVVAEPLEVLKLNVEFELKTGVVRVSGHIGNTDICTKVLIEAAHTIMKTNAENDKARMQAQSNILDIAAGSPKLNGKHEDTAPAAIN